MLSPHRLITCVLVLLVLCPVASVEAQPVRPNRPHQAIVYTFAHSADGKTTVLLRLASADVGRAITLTGCYTSQASAPTRIRGVGRITNPPDEGVLASVLRRGGELTVEGSGRGQAERVLTIRPGGAFLGDALFEGEGLVGATVVKQNSDPYALVAAGMAYVSDQIRETAPFFVLPGDEEDTIDVKVGPVSFTLSTSDDGDDGEEESEDDEEEEEENSEDGVKGNCEPGPWGRM